MDDNNTIEEILFPKFNSTKELADPALQLFYDNWNRRVIWLDDEINWNTCGLIVQWINLLNETQSEDKTPIQIHIMSNGGLLSTMFTLYDTIKKSKIPVETINEGCCHSAAFIIYLAGSKRTMNENACFIAHEGSSLQGGTYRESKAAMAAYERDVQKMKEIISTETSLSVDEINEQFEKQSDWYLWKEEAKKYNIITED